MSLSLPVITSATFDHHGRRSALRERLAEDDLGALLITDLTNVRYLTGFTGSAAVLLVSHDEAWLLTDGRYEQQAAAQTSGCTVLIERNRPLERIADLAAGAEVHRMGAEAAALSWQQSRTLTDAVGDVTVVVPTTGLVEGLRQFKDEHEIAALDAACALTDAAFAALLSHVRPGLTEREVGRFLDRTMEDLGADAPSFETIAASGPNSAIPHHRPTDRVLQDGELLKVDFGAAYAGYHADMTRTISLGDPGTQLTHVHDVVERSQAAGRAAAIVGAATQQVDGVCRAIIVGEGLGDRFVHGTGHGVGLLIHEEPYLGQTSTGTLRAGMPITVEPGVYLPGVGGVRIEDTVLVQADGPPRSLTTSPRELIVL